MRYLVALGEDKDEKCVSENNVLLGVALRHAIPGRDCMLLARVIEEVKPDPAIMLLDILYLIAYELITVRGDDDEQIRLEEEARKKLEVYNKQCINAGIDSGFMVLMDDHAGSALCKAATDHKVDCMVVGRRDMGAFQRFITISTSKYCIDNADCNVIVVRRPYHSEEIPSHELVHQQTIIKEEEREKRQLSSENPSAPHLFTLRNPTEMKRAFVKSVDPKKQAALEEVSRQEEAERKRRLPNMEIELEAERSARQAERELVCNLEEQERAERVQEWKSEEEIERKVRQEESKYNLELTKKMEEDERRNRIELMKDEGSGVLEARANLDHTKKLEEKERKERIRAWNAEEKLLEKERSKESRRDRVLVAKLEEEERADRIAEEEQLVAKEKVQRTLERTVSLEKVHLAEEQERMERVRMQHEEEIREQAQAEVKSKQDIELVNRLEDEEQERRIREDDDELRERERESKLDLQNVKEMEEQERAFRMEQMKSLKAMKSMNSMKSMKVQQ